MVGTPPLRRARNAQRHVTALGKLERVRKQILQNLIEPLRVGVHRDRQTLSDLDLEGEAFLLRDRSKSSFEILLHLLEAQLANVQGDGSGFDLREIEDVIDELQ